MKVKIEKLNVSYGNLLDVFIESLHKDPMKPFIEGMSERWELSKQTQSRLDEILNILIPKVSEKYYDGGDLQVIDVKLLRHLKGSSDCGGAFDWHSDNHPPEILNIIVYISDVDEDGGGMEYCKLDGEILDRPYTHPPGGHVMESEVNNLKQNSNFEIEKMIGEVGTTFVFDNCILHRATSVDSKDRDALLLQVKPK